MKVMFKVENLGLNDFGVQELNNFYRDNISENWVKEFKVGDTIVRKKKIFKQSKSFLNLKEENNIGYFDCKQHIKDSNIGGGYFLIQLKHINYKITKIEVTEVESDFNFTL